MWRGRFFQFEIYFMYFNWMRSIMSQFPVPKISDPYNNIGLIVLLKYLTVGHKANQGLLFS